MGRRADLHIHTTFSDGALSPREIIARARELGLATISITDHDHTGAFAEATDYGRATGVEVIPGIELSVTLDAQEIHLLGYFFDPGNPALQEFLSRIRIERRKRAERIVARLNTLDIGLSLEAVIRQAGEGAIGRPHIANALVEENLVGSYQEAFVRFLAGGKPAYEGKYQVPPREAIEIIAGAGGRTFIAHPGNFLEERMLLRLIHDGVDGIEVVHPSHSSERETHYRGIAGEYFLLTSGGSDFHGGRRNDNEAFGRYTVPYDHVEAMRRRLQ